jgi:hypothetical protein
MVVEVGRLEMWREERLFDSAVSLVEELHFMMIYIKLPAKLLALEQVLER